MQIKKHNRFSSAGAWLVAGLVAVGFAASFAGGLLAADATPEPSALPGQKPADVQTHWQKLWTWPAGGALAGAPAPLLDGWVIATANGRVAALRGDGKPIWSVSFTNINFSDAPVVAGTNVIVISDNGKVWALDAATGNTAWQTTVEGTFMHAPVVMRLDDVWQVVLLSSANGVLSALDARDGHARWQSEPTNRSDGAPATDGKIIAYGNCDAAVHIFDATDGRPLASIPVGANEQMAGGVLCRNGRVYAGTRGGKLVCVDRVASNVVWRVSVSKKEAFDTPVAARDLVLMGTTEGKILACQAKDSVVKWKISLSNAVESLCVADQNVFAVSGGVLSGLRIADGSVFFSLAVGDRVTAPAANGRCIALADDGGHVIVYGEQ